MKAKKLDGNIGLDIMMRKMSCTFEKIDDVCKDLDETRNDFVKSVNTMDMQIRTVKSRVEHQRGDFDLIFRRDGK